MTSSTDLAADVRPADDGPCTPEEARELLERAATAAVEFEVTMRQILRRKAWAPLGYSGPREMFLAEFKDGGLINQQTGKPYGRAHIYRMANLALFLSEIEDRTGIDAAELGIPEKALRAARANGVDPDQLLEQIEQRVTAATVDALSEPEAVQQIVDDVINHAAGRITTPGHETDGPDGRSAVGDSDDKPVDDSAASDSSDRLNRDPHPQLRDGKNASDPFNAFGSQKQGSLAPNTDESSWASAVAGAQAWVDFIEELRRINRLGQQLASLPEVEAKLPEFLDACDDSELDAFTELLDSVRRTITPLPDYVAAIEAIRGEARTRAEDM
ncbi:hypothetical protein [Nocardia sp. NPDC052566]|uniref:hypothetical protein n=1 Tax=Nocardia sp. NPDC052566 TaxID=3364330 RepID=UPI0037CAA618